MSKAPNKFKTLKEQNAEKVIDAMFAGGLEDDIALKTVMRVMYGLEDESVLDELKKVNDENVKNLTENMTATPEDIGTTGKLFRRDSSGNLIEISADSIEETNGETRIQ